MKLIHQAKSTFWNKKLSDVDMKEISNNPTLPRRAGVNNKLYLELWLSTNLPHISFSRVFITSQTTAALDTSV